MIRSFDYAAISALRQITETRPAALPRLRPLAETWRQRAVGGFHAAYRKAMRGSAAYPASKLQGRALVDFFTLEKAIYEVEYELANRPGLGLTISAQAADPAAIARRKAGPEAASSQAVRLRRCLHRYRSRLPRVEAIVAGRHEDPFAFLGMHKASVGLYVRAFLPDAGAVAVIDSAERRGRRAGPSASIRPGCSSPAWPTAREPFRYRLRVRWGGHEAGIRRRLPFSAGARRTRHPPPGRGQPPRQLPEARGASGRA